MSGDGQRLVVAVDPNFGPRCRLHAGVARATLEWLDDPIDRAGCTAASPRSRLINDGVKCVERVKVLRDRRATESASCTAVCMLMGKTWGAQDDGGEPGRRGQRRG